MIFDEPHVSNGVIIRAFQIPELFVAPSRKSSALNESESLPHLDITTVELQWLQVLSEGWAYPLKGFMRENEYLQVKLKDRLIGMLKNEKIFFFNSFTHRLYISIAFRMMTKRVLISPFQLFYR